MKKFYITLALIILFVVMEIIKYFVNFVAFYFLFAFQMAIAIACIVLLCLKPKHKIILSTSFVFSLIFLITPILIGLARIEPLPVTFNYVIHAGGGMDGTPYLNSQEGFLQNVQNGQKYIEVDFLYTSDDKIVASHLFEHNDGFNLKNRPTYDEFTSYKLEGKYTGMTFEWLLDQLEIFDDINIIFDTKESDSLSLLQDMVQIASARNFDIYSRFIVQVYSLENYHDMKEHFDFDRYWYTNYKTEYSPMEIKKNFADYDDIDTIVLWTSDWWVVNQTGIDLGKDIAVHTVHSQSAVNFLATHGVDYIYVDQLK